MRVPSWYWQRLGELRSEFETGPSPKRCREIRTEILLLEDDMRKIEAHMEKRSREDA